MPHVDPQSGALITDHEIGKLPPLLPHEHLAVTTGLAQAARGEQITPSVATQCVHALARLAGLEDTLPTQGLMPPRPAEQLDTPTLVEPVLQARSIEHAPVTAMDLDDKSSRPPRHAAPDDEPRHGLPHLRAALAGDEPRFTRGPSPDAVIVDEPHPLCPVHGLPWRDAGGIY